MPRERRDGRRRARGSTLSGVHTRAGGYRLRARRRPAGCNASKNMI